jgi:hypothetical protein
MKEIEMTIDMQDRSVTTSLPAKVYGSQSGIKILLELDPTSKVVIHKADGTIISYKYKS